MKNKVKEAGKKEKKKKKVDKKLEKKKKKKPKNFPAILEFSLMVMGLNPGYLLQSFLLYLVTILKTLILSV